jgi:hypothetical protein
LSTAAGAAALPRRTVRNRECVGRKSRFQRDLCQRGVEDLRSVDGDEWVERHLHAAAAVAPVGQRLVVIGVSLEYIEIAVLTIAGRLVAGAMFIGVFGASILGQSRSSIGFGRGPSCCEDAFIFDDAPPCGRALFSVAPGIQARRLSGNAEKRYHQASSGEYG